MLINIIWFYKYLLIKKNSYFNNVNFNFFDFRKTGAGVSLVNRMKLFSLNSPLNFNF